MRTGIWAAMRRIPILIAVFAMIAATMPMSAFGASANFTLSKGTAWVQGNGIDSGMRLTTTNGYVAYCMDEGAATPSDTYPNSYQINGRLAAVLYYGYPNTTVIAGYSLTDDQARCATQVAVWACNAARFDIYSSALHGSYALRPQSDLVLVAARALYEKAAAGLPAFGSAVSKPADKSAQLFNQAYRRVGPYTVSGAANVTTSLSGAPAGAFIGDASGNGISVIGNSTFYIYLPTYALSRAGTATLAINTDYQMPVFLAYVRGGGYQDVASYAAPATYSNNGSDPLYWSASTIRKIETGSATPIPDTAFSLEKFQAGQWVTVGTGTTDGNGLLTFPGLGSGRWRITETKPNPKYASPGEMGGSDSRVIDLGQTATNDTQVFENDLISISVQVDKDTIRKTSAAYRSLAGEEGIDNVGQETYHYDIDYRSTASVQADEFVVDDPMEAVSEGHIRLRELWTAVAWGDCDGLMNVWYKTNRTDDHTDYANVSAMLSNAFNPNNPNREPVYPNKGFKLWAQDVRTDARTHLSVDDLDLESGEYVTAVRYEYGAVLRGFTTKNYADESLNGEHHEGLGISGDTVDWAPVQGDLFYAQGAVDAVGLKPVTYLVSCPEPLGEDVVIAGSATARIARNRILLDEDRDEVYTIPIGTFTLEVKPDAPTAVADTYYGVSAPQTGDSGAKPLPWVLIPILCAGLLAGAVALCFAQTRRLPMRLCSVALICVMTGGLALTFVAGGANPFAGIFASGSSSVRNISHPKTVSLTAEASADIKCNQTKEEAGRIYINAPLNNRGAQTGIRSGVRARINPQADETSSLGEKAYSFTIDGDISIASWVESGGKRNFAGTTWVSRDGYGGVLRLVSIVAEPVYRTEEAKVDKTEIVSDLTVEDISRLPEEKTFALRSNDAVDATREIVLKRAGLALTVAGRDADGVPDRWDAKIVYRGLESWLEVDYYKAQATYSGALKRAGANPQPGITDRTDARRGTTGAGGNGTANQRGTNQNPEGAADAVDGEDASGTSGISGTLDGIGGDSGNTPGGNDGNSAVSDTSRRKSAEPKKKADSIAAAHGAVGNPDKGGSKDPDQSSNPEKSERQSGHASGKTDVGGSALENSGQARPDTISGKGSDTDRQAQNGGLPSSLQRLWPFLLPVLIVLAAATILVPLFIRIKKQRAARRH